MAAILNNQPSANTPYMQPWEDLGGGPPLQHQQINQQYQQAMSHHPWVAPAPLAAPHTTSRDHPHGHQTSISTRQHTNSTWPNITPLWPPNTNNNNRHTVYMAAARNNQPSVNTHCTQPWEYPGGGLPPQQQQLNQQYQQATRHNAWEVPASIPAPTYHIPGPPPWLLQGLPPRETDYTSGMQALAQPTYPHTHHYPMENQQIALNPSWLQLISRTVLATVANLQQATMMATGVNTHRNLTTTTRSIKLLNRTNKHSLLGFCGQSIQESPPKIFIILDRNEDATTKFHALED